MWCTGVQCLNSENAFVGQPNWPGGQPLGAGSPCHGCWCIHSEWGMNLRGLLDHLGRGKANWQQQGLICWDHKTKDSWYSYMDVDWKFICYSMLSSLKCRHCELGPGSQSGSCSCSFKHWGGFRNSPWVICTKRIFRSREFSRAAPVQPRQEALAMKKDYEDAGYLQLLQNTLYHLVDVSMPPRVYSVLYSQMRQQRNPQNPLIRGQSVPLFVKMKKTTVFLQPQEGECEIVIRWRSDDHHSIFGSGCQYLTWARRWLRTGFYVARRWTRGKHCSLWCSYSDTSMPFQYFSTFLKKTFKIVVSANNCSNKNAWVHPTTYFKLLLQCTATDETKPDGNWSCSIFHMEV